MRRESCPACGSVVLVVDSSRSTPQSPSVSDLQAQLERLKAELLTPEEALEILDDSNLCARLDEDTLSKLHRIAQSDTGAHQEEVKE